MSSNIARINRYQLNLQISIFFCENTTIHNMFPIIPSDANKKLILQELTIIRDKSDKSAYFEVFKKLLEFILLNFY